MNRWQDPALPPPGLLEGAARRLRGLGVPVPGVTAALDRAAQASLEKDRGRRTYLAEAQRMGYSQREADLVLAAVNAALERTPGHVNPILLAAGVLAGHRKDDPA